MGQYHTIANRTKKEFFSIGLAKLLEKSFDPLNSTALMVLLANSNGRGGGDLYVQRAYKGSEELPLTFAEQKVNACLQAMSGRWSGDAVVIQGDYAKPTDTAFISEEEWREYTDITELVLTALYADTVLAELVSKEKEMQAQVSRFHAKVSSNVVALKPKAKGAKPKKRRSKLQPWQIGG